MHDAWCQPIHFTCLTTWTAWGYTYLPTYLLDCLDCQTTTWPYGAFLPAPVSSASIPLDETAKKIKGLELKVSVHSIAILWSANHNFKACRARVCILTYDPILAEFRIMIITYCFPTFCPSHTNRRLFHPATPSIPLMQDMESKVAINHRPTQMKYYTTVTRAIYPSFRDVEGHEERAYRKEFQVIRSNSGDRLACYCALLKLLGASNGP